MILSQNTVVIDSSLDYM